MTILVVHYSLTRARQILYKVYHKHANLFLCTPKIYKAYAFMYAFYPIAYRSLSTECPWFSLFFYNTLIEECFSQQREKSLASHYV